MLSAQTATVPRSSILRKCCVVGRDDYYNHQPVDVPENDVFVCVAKYDLEHRHISARGYKTSPNVTLQPPKRPRNFDLVHCGDKPIAAVNSIAEEELLISMGSGEPIQIEFIADQDISSHIRNIVPQQDDATGRSKTLERKTSASNNIPTPLRNSTLRYCVVS